MKSDRVKGTKPTWVTNNFDGPEVTINMRSLAATADFICSFRLDADHCPYALLAPACLDWPCCEYAKDRGDEPICTSRRARRAALFRIPDILSKISDKEDTDGQQPTE